MTHDGISWTGPRHARPRPSRLRPLRALAGVLLPERAAIRGRHAMVL